MLPVSFFLPCIPPKVSHHAKRIVRRGKFSSLADSPKLETARGDLITLLKDYTPAAPYDNVPLILRAEFIWPWLRGDTLRVRARGQVWHDTKPDADNIAKTLIDCLVCCAFFSHDSRIVSLKVLKFRGEKPGIDVQLSEAK